MTNQISEAYANHIGFVLIYITLKPKRLWYIWGVGVSIVSFDKQQQSVGGLPWAYNWLIALASISLGLYKCYLN